MKTEETKKKVWTKPIVQTLNIKKDTFSGSQNNMEGVDQHNKPGSGSSGGPPVPHR